MIAFDGAPTFIGSMTWNPCPLAGAPSAWMEIATLACASLPIAARLSTHGPTLVLSVRVMTTFAPAARSRATSRVATSNVNAASGYPLLVEVPVVSHSLVPVPIGTCLLMISGWAALPPLCPGSTRIVRPATALRSSGPVTGAGAADPGAEGAAAGGGPAADGATEAPVAGAAQFAVAAEPPPHPASPSISAARTAAVRTGTGTRLMLLAGRKEHDFRAGPAVPLGHDREHVAGRIEHRVRHRDPHRRQRPAMAEYPGLVRRGVPAGEEPGRRLGQRQGHRIRPGFQ